MATDLASQPTRARSSTSGSVNSGRPRPISRGSTTSVHTPNPQPVQPQHAPEASHLPPTQHPYPHQIQYAAAELPTPSEQRVIHSAHEYVIDPSLQGPRNGTRGTSTDHAYNMAPGGARPPMHHHHSFNVRGTNYPAQSNREQAPDDAAAGEAKKKKGSASSIANDQELRKLFRENHHRDLKEVASQVLVHERGPKSEKTKQIFAMNWLNTVCVKSTKSVPRNRVFSHYATRCGTERVPPLNPASFGKLVRIIFPGIQTRRLGMRGESKYHYVDLALIDEQTDNHSGEQIHGEADYYGASENFAARRSHLPIDTAVFPSPHMPPGSNHNGYTESKTNASAQLYIDATKPRIHHEKSCPNMVRRQLKFPTHDEPPYTHNEEFELPSLTSYLPENTDPDASDALVALYRTHCISVIDCFRFCKERMFWHHFTSFHGTLTVPVQKLLAHPKIADWITECDWLMYQKMIRFVSPLALQVMPTKVIDTFRNISIKLVLHISNTFQNHPQHVRDAKIGPASIFAGLIDRLLRVNATAHAAANMLTNDANRDQMWHDWVCYVKPIGVVESTLPCHGYRRTLQILLLEVGELLGPLRSLAYQGMQQIFVNAQAEPGSDHNRLSHPELDDSSTSGVLDRWTTFLHDLPSRFPSVDARLLIWCVGEVTSACIRDITMAQALSFGSWWVTKVWVDEMLRWIAEKGGFLECGPSSMTVRPRKRTVSDAGFEYDVDCEFHGGSRPRTGISDGTDGPSRYGSVDLRNDTQGDNSQDQDSHRNTQHPPEDSRGGVSGYMNGSVPPPPRDNGFLQQAKREPDPDRLQGQDDSGIGMDLELPQNTPIRLADYGGFVANNVGGSDPADVVVC